MLWFTFVVLWHYPQYLNYYIALLIFLGVVLKPLLIKTGAYDFFLAITNSFSEKREARRNETIAREVERKERDKRYKSRRVKDPKLPKNW